MESYKLCQICRAIDFKSLVYGFSSSSSSSSTPSSSSSLSTNNGGQKGLNADNSLQGELPHLSTNDETSAPRLSNTPHDEWPDPPSSTQLIPRTHSYSTMLEGDDSFSLSRNQSGDSQDSVLASPGEILDRFDSFSVEFNSHGDNSPRSNPWSLHSVASSMSLPIFNSEDTGLNSDEFSLSVSRIDDAEDRFAHDNPDKTSLITSNFITDNLDDFPQPQDDSSTEGSESNGEAFQLRQLNSGPQEVGQKEKVLASRPRRESPFELGYLDDIEQRSSECAFCHLITESTKQMIKRLRKNAGETSTTKDNQRLRCSLKQERLCYLYKSHNNFGRDGFVNRLELQLDQFPFPSRGGIKLQPCSFPIPRIEDYLESKSFAEEMEDIKASGRLMKSDANAHLFRKWLLQCEMTHGRNCSHPKWFDKIEQPKGLKVIDVENMSIVDALPNCRYFALSYVWGNLGCMEASRSTTKNITQRRNKNGLNEEVLSKATKDAIYLVKEMKERYLWVDALCINQDDELEKATFIQHMDLIFSAALVTVIAAGQDADSGLVGLHPHSRVVDQRFAQVGNDLVLMRIVAENRSYNLKYSDWNDRGWTYQENYLSRRALIFTQLQVYWQCQMESWNEENVFEPPKPRARVEVYALGYDDECELGYRRFGKENLEGVVSRIYKRVFTYPRDILDSVAGIFRRIALTTGETFHWGLPRTRFDQALLWDAEGRRRRDLRSIVWEDGIISQIPFPSWTWASRQSALWPGICTIPKWNRRLESCSRAGLTGSELEYYCVSLDGRIAKLDSVLVAKTGSDVPENDPFEALRKLWKGPTQIPVDKFDDSKPFRDSGRLMFWTSCAKLKIRRDDKALTTEDDVKVGVFKSFSITGKLSFSDDCLHDFIVVSRYCRFNSSWESRKLNVMLVKWNEKESDVASRVALGIVSEASWVNTKREWKKIILE